MYLEGDCNDYVGKGMAGGKLVIALPEGSRFESRPARAVYLPLRGDRRSIVRCWCSGRAFRSA